MRLRPQGSGGFVPAQIAASGWHVTYKLHRLARGSYDLVLDGEIVGSVVRKMTTGGNFKGWRAELLDDDSGAAKPEPFTAGAHDFGALSDVTDWLGSAEVVDEPSDG